MEKFDFKPKRRTQEISKSYEPCLVAYAGIYINYHPWGCPRENIHLQRNNLQWLNYSYGLCKLSGLSPPAGYVNYYMGHN